MELTKQYVNDLKQKDNGEFLEIIDKAKDNNIVFILENLGRLPKNFNGEWLTKLLNNSNDKIRLLAVKNIGKLANIKYLDVLYALSKSEKNSMIRREAVSSIGRIRNEKTISKLLDLLNDIDPKVSLQAIRGLLVFKNNTNVKQELLKLKKHPNEIIQEIIQKELFSKKENKKINHTKSPDYMKNVIVEGDVKEVLKYVPDNSIHLTFTSPPYYNARDYSIYNSYEEYLKFLANIFKEVHRITKDGRFFLLNTSPVIIPRFSRQYSSKRYPIPYDIHPYLIGMGWEFIDDIIWLKPEASAKNRTAGFLQHRKPLAYKPNCVTENIMVYRKKTTKLIDWNIKQYNSDIIEKSKVLGKYETSSVWKIDPVNDKTHSAVFPVKLCDRVIRYYSYKEDLVFDPFAGIGTMGKSAMALGRYFFLTEINKDYIKKIKEELGDMYFLNKMPNFLNIEKFKEIAKAKAKTEE